jgi:hypothetical protein
MKVTIRVEITTDWDETDTFEVCQLERPYRQLDPDKVGLSLAEGKDLLHRLQQVVVAARAEEVCTLRRFCTRCHRYLELKDRRIRKVDTVFGTVPFRSARIVCCPCETPLQMEYPYSPMTEFVPERATAELLSLEARLSAQMPYGQVVTMMREFLPVRETLNHVTVRNRALRVGARIEAVPPAACRAQKEETEWTLTIDGGFVRGRRKSECSSFEVLTGCLSARDQASRVFAFVRNRLPDIVNRLTTLVKTTTGSDQPRLSVITDGANGLQSIACRLPFSPTPVLDWFHISMRVRHLEQIIKGMGARTETEKAARRVLISRVDKLRWCFWHARLEKAKVRMQGILLLCRVIVAETPGVAESLAQLDYRTRELVEYVEANGGSTINYGARHRRGKPISTATAESAVNQVLNQRMCKRQQMRWSPIGAHLLAQVRCAVINGDLVQRVARYEPPRKPLSREAAELLEQFGLASQQLQPQGS